VAAWPMRRSKVVVTVAVLALAASTAAGLFWRSRRVNGLTEKDTILLGDFANFAGDPVFDGTLREGLSVQLQQSPFLSLVSEEGIHRTLGMMGQRANARLTPAIAREVCQRTNSRAALDGSIALIGSRYDLILKAVNRSEERRVGKEGRYRWSVFDYKDMEEYDVFSEIVVVITSDD